VSIALGARVRRFGASRK